MPCHYYNKTVINTQHMRQCTYMLHGQIVEIVARALITVLTYMILHPKNTKLFACFSVHPPVPWACWGYGVSGEERLPTLHLYYSVKKSNVMISLLFASVWWFISVFGPREARERKEVCHWHCQCECRTSKVKATIIAWRRDWVAKMVYRTQSQKIINKKYRIFIFTLIAEIVPVLDLWSSFTSSKAFSPNIVLITNVLIFAPKQRQRLRVRETLNQLTPLTQIRFGRDTSSASRNDKTVLN